MSSRVGFLFDRLGPPEEDHDVENDEGFRSLRVEEVIKIAPSKTDIHELLWSKKGGKVFCAHSSCKIDRYFRRSSFIFD